MPATKRPQAVRFESLSKHSLQEILGLTPPALLSAQAAYRQLRYVEDYVKDEVIGCETVAIEDHYIDRDFMEDFSVFYGRSLLDYPNSCRRVHFFRGSPDVIEAGLGALLKGARGAQSSSSREYEKACVAFSEKYYCGFCVIKPLDGSPVGRTVLRVFPPDAPDGYTRQFDCIRLYQAHLLGVELSVQGLAFQQQDVGVAACATTALWTALQKTRDHEDLGIVTPAHITLRATKARLPFGRAMPSEGLSIDQMSQSVQAFGVSPVLTRVASFDVARSELHSAVLSGFSPVLIIERGTKPNTRHHAIAVVGLKLKALQTPPTGEWSHASEILAGVYVHDDRYGPYLRAMLSSGGDGGMSIAIRKRKLNGNGGEESEEGDDNVEPWRVTHTLIPTPLKVRLSFLEIRSLASDSLKVLGFIWNRISARIKTTTPHIVFDIRVARAHAYVRSLAVSEPGFSPASAVQLARTVPLPRWIGIVRFMARGHPAIHVLVDTTATRRNHSFVAICLGHGASAETKEVAERFANVLSCPFIG